MLVAAGQFTVSSNVARNFQTIAKLIRKAHALRVQLLLLPEASDYLAPSPTDSFHLSQTVHDTLVKPLSALVKELGSLAVCIGIHEPADNGKTKNKLLYLDNSGTIIHQYQKLHLFDVDIVNGPVLRESNSVVRGDAISEPFEVIPGSPFKIGLQICYDIRFPELSLHQFKKGANILIYPSAFTVKTGEAHWETLGKTRAIDNQSYVIMPAQCGKHDIGVTKTERVSYGRSLIIDPWGEIVGEGKKYDDQLEKDEDGDYYELVTADLDINRVESVRANMPLLNHRRNDIEF